MPNFLKYSLASLGVSISVDTNSSTEGDHYAINSKMSSIKRLQSWMTQDHLINPPSLPCPFQSLSLPSLVFNARLPWSHLAAAAAESLSGVGLTNFQIFYSSPIPLGERGALVDPKPYRLDHGGQRLGCVDYISVVPLSAQFQLGWLELGKNGGAVGQSGGTS